MLKREGKFPQKKKKIEKIIKMGKNSTFFPSFRHHRVHFLLDSDTVLYFEFCKRIVMTPC